MNTAKKTTLQETVAYRIGKFTSKVSIQPAIFEGILNLKCGDRADTLQYFRELAVEGKESGVKDVSLFVQSVALTEISPRKARVRVDFDAEAVNRVVIRFKNPITNRITKLSTFKTLIDILNVLYPNKAEDIHSAFAVDYCNMRTSLAKEEQGKCDLSHVVRERIISNLAETA